MQPLISFQALARSDGFRKLQWPLLALAGLLLFNLVFSPEFLRVEIKNGHLYGSTIDIFNRGAPVMLLALGMSLVIATGGVDLSVGALMAVSGAVAAILISRAHLGAMTAALGAIAAGLAGGAFNGVLVSLLRVQPIVATLILMVAGRGIAQLLSGGQIITFRNPGLEFLGGGYFAGLPFAISVVACVFVALGLFMRQTALGLFVEAVGNNERASRYAGISTGLIKFSVYLVSGGCAGLAGLIVASNIRAADANSAGLWLELDAILAVVIGGAGLTGGRFYLFNSLVGALLIQTLTTTILTRGIPVEFTLVVKAVVIIGVCLIQAEDFRRMLRGVWRPKQLGQARPK